MVFSTLFFLQSVRLIGIQAIVIISIVDFLLL